MTHLLPDFKFDERTMTIMSPVEYKTRAFGIDCSRWQDDNSTPQKMDFKKAYAAGARFAFIKASQACWMDEDFTYNWKSAKEAGLLRRAFHFMDWTESGYDQAMFFCGLLKKDPGEIDPAIDYECRNKGGKEIYEIPNFRYGQAVPQLRSFCDVLLKEFNLPAIYTGQWYWKNFGSEDEYYKQLQLWLAYVDGGWPAPAIIPKPWDYASWIQFTWTLDGKKYGAESDGLDGNWFNGTLEELYILFGSPDTEPTAEPDEDEDPILFELSTSGGVERARITQDDKGWIITVNK